MKKQHHTIVLIHGFGFDAGIWAPIEGAFNDYRVIKLSLPGFGETEITGPYSIRDLASHYWKLLESADDSVFHLVGHSMGGYVIMEMAAMAPGRIGSLALIHSHVFEDPDDRKAKRDEAIAGIEKDGHAAFATKMIGGMVGSDYKPKAEPLLADMIERGIGRGPEAWLHGIAAMRNRNDHGETLRRLRVPVLMIMGEEDAAIPLDLVYKQSAIAERADLYVLRGTGHLSMYEKTPEVTGILKAFYKNVIG
jgi:pimeloyl-ACP methyl ester carboxylesterase